MAEFGPVHPFLQWILPSAIVAALSLGLSLLLLRRRRTASTANGIAAGILAAEGALTLLVGFTWMGFSAGDPRGEVVGATARALLGIILVLYLGLLSTLRTPLVAWLKKGRWLLAAAVVFAVNVWVLLAEFDPTPVMLQFVALIGVPIFALIATFHAMHLAPRGSEERRRAQAFAVAFATRDILAIVFWVLVSTGSPDVTQMPEWKLYLAFATNPLAIMQVIYLPLLAYGILRSQLFDVDLRIKQGVSAGTVTAILVATYFVISEATQQVVGDRAGPYAGIAAAGGLLLAIHPLSRFGKRVAQAAMPGVDGSDQYLSERKMQVYRAAAEGAFADGALTTKERVLLSRLGGELGLDPRDMVAIEDEIRASFKALAGNANP